jgi:hypothetical protein
MSSDVGPFIQIDFNGSIEASIKFRDWVRSGDYLTAFAEWCAEQDVKYQFPE